MNLFNELHERMDFFAEAISSDLADKRYYEVKEIKASIKTKLWFAISDCLNIQLTDKERERRKLVQEYCKEGLPFKKRLELGAVLAKVNAEIKDANILRNTMNSVNDYKLLRAYVKEIYGQEVLDDFTNNLESKKVIV